jgi:leader peptidase (prepilin peptidase)/N-methyltransferase
VSPELFSALVAGVFGALIGSFLNVCISRLPAGLSVVRPRSRCPKCETPIAWFDNIPVISWLLLRGRCRSCRASISIAYPLVELMVAFLWAWMAWRHGLGVEALRWAIFGSLLIGIAMTDAREFIIPHEFTFGGILIAIVAAFGGGLGGVVGALNGAIFGAGLVYLIGAAGEFAFKKEAMGGGDVAMMAMVGSFLGWQSVVATIFIGAAVGVVLHLLAQMAPGRRGGKAVGAAKPAEDSSAPSPLRPSAQEMTPDQLRASGYLPFGVSLAIAAGVIAFVLGPERVAAWFAWYAGMIGL